ncbi:PI-PLC X domain-containing protein 1-like [Osmerus eperlanus]|uniref:PI-PLC X domain-containing protein 1-like n=1 Tax=Osmerus eperlanus TaxID=29151 RepID=UPI002E152FA9
MASELVDGTGELEESGNANWMSKLPEKLQATTLWELAIPGSHDTMCYDLDQTSPVMEPDTLVKLDQLLPSVVRPIIYRWATTQESGVTEQLNLGVRFFDLRIAHKPDDSSNTLYFAHGLFTHSTVESVLSEIHSWLENHSKEVVILALSHFHNLSVSNHDHLVSFIKTLFGSKLLPRQDLPTLQTCWESKKQVIISYDFLRASDQNLELWLSVPYHYGDTLDPEKVIAVLDQKLQEGRPARFFISGLNLTLPESPEEVLKHVLGSLRDTTLPSLPRLLDWVKRQTPGPGKTCINIICSDFVNHMKFVPLIIKLNDKLLSQEEDSTTSSSDSEY